MTIWAVIPTLYRPPTLAPLLEVLAADGVEVVLLDTKGRDPDIYRWWNEGRQQALDGGAEYIAYLNDDITIAPGTLPLLARAMDENPKLGVASPELGYVKWEMPETVKLEYTAGLWNDNGQGRKPPHRGMTPYCFMVRAAVDIPFDETYRWWAGDNAFELAVRSSNWKLANVLGVYVHHDTSYSGKKRWTLLSPIAAEDVARWRVSQDVGRIPSILHRIAIGPIPSESQRYWEMFRKLHPAWLLMTHTEDADPTHWPLTSGYWSRSLYPAQQADLMRLEALWKWGGIYVDWDFEPYRSFDPLLPLQAFAAYENRRLILNGLIGARPGHPAIKKAIDIALRNMDAEDRMDYLIMYQTGPGVVTEAFKGRDDVLLLPPDTFYPYGAGTNAQERRDTRRDYRDEKPWTFASHHWFASWEPEEQQPAYRPSAKASPTRRMPRETKL